MKKQNKTALIAAAIAVALLIAALLFFNIFKNRSAGTDPSITPGALPDESFAQLGTQIPTQAECFEAYDRADDPAHPVLSSPVKLSISNLGSRPGQPRPQNIDEEYPVLLKTPEPIITPKPTIKPEATLNPSIILPGRPGLVLPDLKLPKLYLVEPDIVSPQFTQRAYLLRWAYTANRDATFTVSESLDGGETFQTLADGLTKDSYELIFSKTPAKSCVLRVTAMVGEIAYLNADTSPFALVEAPETPAPVINYVDEQVQYTDMPGVHINAEANSPVWFKAQSSAKDAVTLIWQLSDTPFWGTRESFDFETPLASGEAAPDASGEFNLDIAALCEQLNKPTDKANAPFLPKQPIYALHLRVVALDGDGNCIGDPGQGISFTYGDAQIVPDALSANNAKESGIGILINQPYYYEYKWQRVAPGVLNRDIASSPDSMLLSAVNDDAQTEAIIRDAVQVEIQVATSPFANTDVQAYAKPAGLVYSYMDTAPDISETLDGYSYITPHSHGLEYEQFALPKEELDKLGGIYYYARAVFYVPDKENPSVLHPVPSETLTIAYRVTKAKENQVQQVTVRSNLPFVQFVRYMPVQWQAPNYDEYFEVTRHIEAEEMTFTISRTDGSGEILYPYEYHIQTYHWTREQYQQKLDEMLPPGASFQYQKSQPAGFWNEFFSLLSSIYNAVKDSYAGAKDSVIAVIDYIPLIGDDAREYLKSAARMAIDYGLASIGLPPSLPNLDVLAEGSFDYLLRVAIDETLRQAGVPADSAAAKEITEQVTKQVTDGMAQGLEASLIATRQNPFNVDFLRLYQRTLYRPAYIDVSVANYSEKYSTVAGTLGLGFGDATRVYKPAVVAIPPLKPGESTIIRVYLEHVRNLYDGYGKYFDDIYYGSSHQPFELRVGMQFDLPDVREAAKAQGLVAAPLPYVTEYVYDHAPYVYSRPFIPAEEIWDEDDSVNPVEYFDEGFFDKYE